MNNEELVAKIKEGNDISGNMMRLWQQNQGFIGRMAVKYSGYAEIEDLKQEGYIALYEAVNHYDPAAGVPFINYAAFWIKQQMCRYIDNCGSVVRIPVGVRADIRRYKRICNEYRKYYGAEPSERELCALMRMNREELYKVQENARKEYMQSLSAPLGDDGDELKLEDTVASDENLEEDCISRLDREAMKRELWIAVDSLPADQKQVIQCRYMDGLTLKETGERQGITIDRARSISDKALKTLRRPRHSRKFRAYFEQYLSAAPVHHVGVQSFQRTWTSEVERDVLGL